MFGPHLMFKKKLFNKWFVKTIDYLLSLLLLLSWFHDLWFKKQKDVPDKNKNIFPLQMTAPSRYMSWNEKYEPRKIDLYHRGLALVCLWRWTDRNLITTPIAQVHTVALGFNGRHFEKKT